MVELEYKPDGTDHGDERVESADERWRTDGGVERNGGTEDKVGRTDEADRADNVELARTDEDSGRQKQEAVTTVDEQSSDDKTLYLQQHATQII